MQYCLTLALLCASARLATAGDYTSLNYPDRRALTADVCPHLKITSFSFGNALAERTYSPCFKSDYAWENVGQKDITSFELVVLKYDPFNRPLIGSRVILPGHNSAKYKPLKAGEKDDDGSSSYGSEETYTAVCYVRNIRFADGTVWTLDVPTLVSAIKKLVPDIVDPGPLDPQEKKEKDQQG